VHNAAWLWDELRDQGYRGSRRSVRRYLNTLHASTPTRSPSPPLPVRTFRRLVLRRPDRLAPRNRARLDAVAGRCPPLPPPSTSPRASPGCYGNAAVTNWAPGSSTPKPPQVPELRAFALGLRRDWDAVTAGLTLPWSSGAVEGHVNRIKTLKRQMYGRANLDPLRHRVLLA
jgi:hypothetical protein